MPNQVLLTLQQTSVAPQRPSASAAAMIARASNQMQAESVSIRWLEGNADSIVSGERQLPGTANYFLGNDASRWRTTVPTYALVRYSKVYPGIELVYYGTGGQLEYDVVVHPGADPSRIHLAIDGARSLAGVWRYPSLVG